MQDATVDDHHLAVIADQVVGGPRDGDALLEQVQFELAEALLTAFVRVRNQRNDFNAAFDRPDGIFELVEIESENDNHEPPLCPLDGREQRRDALIGLRHELHAKT